MSVFADKRSSPFNNNIPFGLLEFHISSFGEFQRFPNFPLFGNVFEEDKEDLWLNMRLRNGSVVTEPGFYGNFDSIFHDKTSRRYDVRQPPADDSRRRSASNGRVKKEYVIPIKVETTSKSDRCDLGKSDTASSSASNGSKTPPSQPSSPVELEILHCDCDKIVTDDTGHIARTKSPRDKSRSPLLPHSFAASSSVRQLTPTTEDHKHLPSWDDKSRDVVLDSDIFFVKSEQIPKKKQGLQAEGVSAEPDVQIVENGDYNSFRRSLCRKPLRHYQNSQHVSTPGEAVAASSRPSRGGSAKEASVQQVPSRFEGREKVKVTTRSQMRGRRSQKEAVCSHPGRYDVAAPSSYPVYDYLIPRLASEDRQIDSIRGDGNCFFRAVSKAVYGSENYHLECRQAMCDLIHNDLDLFRQFIDHDDIRGHVTEMCVPGTWATTCEIYAAATLLNRDIYMLAPSPSASDEQYHWLLFSPRPVSRPAIGSLDQREIEVGGCYLTLCHTNANHYDHIVPLGGFCNCELEPPGLNGVNDSVDLTAANQNAV